MMNDQNERAAACSCGQLRVTTRGEPDIVVACSCIACQKRTGSPFGVGAYFRREQVAPVEGESKSFRRETDSGRTFTTKFCPRCGTSVLWELDMRPDHIGVAVGCFADPDFPAPVRAVWSQSRHHWLDFPDALPEFGQAAS